MVVVNSYDALLVLSFGGPERPEDVRPFLENVTRGRNVPAARLEEAASHYDHFGGVSPIAGATRALAAAIATDIDLPVYVGNRNWHPLVEDTVRRMADDGVRRAACFVTSAYGGYSACRQYREDIARARAAVGARAPAIDKLRPYYDHSGFVVPAAENVIAALDTLDPAVRSAAHLAFTAHSVPLSQPGVATYTAHVDEATRLVAARIPGTHATSLSWQSRSGSPSQPWLEPSLADRLDDLAAAGNGAVVVVPIGFVSDHMEVVYDLDIEAASQAERLGLTFARAATVGIAPAFVRMVGQLLAEAPRQCPGDCCMP